MLYHGWAVADTIQHQHKFTESFSTNASSMDLRACCSVCLHTFFANDLSAHFYAHYAIGQVQQQSC